MEKIIVLLGLSVCSLVGAQDIDGVQRSVNVHQQSWNNIQWKIESETKRLHEHHVQKATAMFEGRKLIAWFTTDVEILTGHYQLGGLPGLILYVEDSQKDFVYRTNVKKLYGRNIKMTTS
ncbi:GLPGLI family protein [Chryseobacterium luteum]|uniref:GLPGLI family protein n=1 Tax=Chryseobacterium luteum TaxID=421531 RepID=A0A085ZVK1_9FLAO|nr:GLPGLI family protein [Chryseobacterium luteum]KFF08465.1 hypothetical protein IX38_06795 [Chryseobacterium luteum]